MADPAHLALLYVHVFSGVAWLGAAATLGDRAQALAASSASDESTRGLLRRDVKRQALSSTLNVLTGVGLIFMLGGFGAAHPRFHAALGLSLAWLGMAHGMLGANVRRCVTAAESGQNGEARAHAKKAQKGATIGKLLFFAILATMLWR